MINVVKLTLLLWILFMTCNFGINIATVTAIEPSGEDFPATTTATPSGVDGPSSSETEDPALPSEVQKAVCTVTAGEVKASAEAVTTKTLKGVCGSAELQLALGNLESKLYQELQEIKLLLQSWQNANNLPNMPLQPHNGIVRNMEVNAVTTTATSEAPLKPQTIVEQATKSINEDDEARHIARAHTIANSFIPIQKPTGIKLKSLPSVVRQKQMEREQEVSKFNNTMLADKDFKAFTYYWKLENFTKLIESGESAQVESPIFSIKGKPLHIKAFFQHLHRDFLYLQLEYATLKHSNRNNIVLDMGGLFKQIANENGLFKHKISILDQRPQHSQHSSKDLVSQEFSNLETGFLIPNSALLSSSFWNYINRFYMKQEI